MQSHGTGRVAILFGPLMVIWFLVLAIIGAVHIADYPGVFHALNPYYAVSFMVINPGVALVTLAAVFLVITGSEALYADLGHFGRKPIQAAWVALVLPALLLNYFGQGALVLADPSAMVDPFYRLVPESLLSAAGRAGDDGNRGRQPGRDHRRLFDHAAGHPARPVAAL